MCADVQPQVRTRKGSVVFYACASPYHGAQPKQPSQTASQSMNSAHHHPYVSQATTATQAHSLPVKTSQSPRPLRLLRATSREHTLAQPSNGFVRTSTVGSPMVNSRAPMLGRSVTVDSGLAQSQKHITFTAPSVSVAKPPAANSSGQVPIFVAQVQIDGLALWLQRVGLEQCEAEAAKWIDEQGACDLQEIVENIEQFADALNLGQDAKGRLLQTAKIEAGVVERRLAEAKQGPITIAKTHSSPQYVLRTVRSVPVTGTERKDVHVMHGRVLKPASEAQAGNTFTSAMSRTVTEQWDEAEAAVQHCIDRWADVEPQETQRQWKVRVARDVPQYWTPPRSRWRVDEKLLKAPIPSDEELKAIENARAKATARKNAAWEGSLCEQKEKIKAPGKNSCEMRFERMRTDFLEQHGQVIQKELGSEYKLVPADVSDRIKEKFVQTVTASKAVPDFGYHGTPQRNIPAILEKGLLVPGDKSGIGIAHGAAHGVGIYTALPGSQWLSRGFCDSKNMLVCGVVDPDATSPPVSTNTQGPPGTFGYPFPTRETDALRVVGDARIIFKEDHVAPLFVAQQRNDANEFVRVGASEVLPAPNNNKRGFADRGGNKGQVYVKEVGETMWSPPEEVRGWKEIHEKRRLVRKERQLVRSAARNERTRGGAFA